jgi:hypothetical protein
MVIDVILIRKLIPNEQRTRTGTGIQEIYSLVDWI